MSPHKGYTPTFVDNKGEPWESALCRISRTTVMVFICVYLIDVIVERPIISCSNKYNLHLKKCFADFVMFNPSNKV